MSTPHVLFISGGIGLGHVIRDLAITAELRTLCPGLRLIWLAAEPARQVLREAGEELAPQSERFAGETELAEELAGPFSLPLTNPAALLKSPRVLQGVIRLMRNQKRNSALFTKLTDRQRFDLIIGDEAYDLMLAIAHKPALKPAPLAMIFDFVGLDVTSRNPLEWLWVQSLSWWGVRLVKRLPRVFDLTLMVGEEEDVADKPFGLFMPNRRELARQVVRYVGYICPFNPADYQNRLHLRQRLGYRPGPLVICSIGGTAIGKALLELCGRAYPFLKGQSPELRMVLVGGPRLRPETLNVPEGVERKGYVHRLFEHLAACDLAVVQGGGTTTLELTALRRPFIYFPLEKHFEQRSHVATRIERHRAGVRLEFSRTPPEALAAAVLANIGAEVQYPPIATDGARRAAEYLCRLMENRYRPWSTRPA
jgi:UDP:flavonoid glycosyltransferase YjiC (YdhE family)